jgi:large subunit ribosomal protein L24
MKQKFRKSWKASKQPRKQRKYAAKAPLHLKRKMLSANLSKDLREKHKTRNLPVRKGDTVVIKVGKFRGRKGKVTKVILKTSKVIVDGVQIKKKDGSKIDVKMEPSNLQIVELHLEDKMRLGKPEAKQPKEKEEPKTDKPKVSKQSPKEIKPKSKQEIKEKK